MSNVIITPKTGTVWAGNNLCVDSTDLDNAGYTKANLTISATTTNINGIDCQGIVGANSTGTKSITESATNGSLNGNQMFVNLFVAAGDNAHCYLQARALNAGFATVGGTQWFNLTTGALGTFTALGAGTLADAGIESVTGGYRIWVVVNTGGNDDQGSGSVIGFADADANLDSTGDASTINGYAGGWSWLDDPTGDIGYIPS